VADPIGLGTVGVFDNARQTIRYQLRPVGYGERADLYLYASHFKASPGGNNAVRRDIEATTNRADANALGRERTSCSLATSTSTADSRPRIRR
jgi:hypothetical protein